MDCDSIIHMPQACYVAIHLVFIKLWNNSRRRNCTCWVGGGGGGSRAQHLGSKVNCCSNFRRPIFKTQCLTFEEKDDPEQTPRKTYGQLIISWAPVDTMLTWVNTVWQIVWHSKRSHPERKHFMEHKRSCVQWCSAVHNYHHCIATISQTERTMSTAL